MKLYFSWLAQGMVLIFALIGLLLTAGFIGVKYGWTNVAGVAELPSATTRSVRTVRVVAEGSSATPATLVHPYLTPINPAVRSSPMSAKISTIPCASQLK